MSIIFFGDIPIHFQAPGPMHRTKWMAKILYSMKIWMCRSQLKLTTKVEHSFPDMLIFTIKVFLKAWMEASEMILDLPNRCKVTCQEN